MERENKPENGLDALAREYKPIAIAKGLAGRASSEGYNELVAPMAITGFIGGIFSYPLIIGALAVDKYFRNTQ